MIKSSDVSTTKAPRGPFYRPLRIRDVPTAGVSRQIEATPDECAAMARELKFPAIASLRADLTVKPAVGGRFDVSGRVDATLSQVCVATLEPFESTIAQDVEISFAPPVSTRQTDSADRRLRAVDIELELQDDAPDPLLDDTIDLGAVAMEFMVLACDPYPKKPGVHFTDVLIGNKEEEPSPFAALGRLKDNS